MNRKSGFAPTVMGRPNLAPLRTDLPDGDDVKARSDLDLHIVRLLALHPKTLVRFRNQDIASLDDSTKKTLLDDLNFVLGIKPQKKR